MRGLSNDLMYHVSRQQRQEEHPACKNRVMGCYPVGAVICLERGADCLHTVQLMPLP